MQVLLARPRGFCAGVERAIEIVELALAKFGAPIYVRHEIVHNKYVVEELKGKGVVFVKELDEIPDGGVTVFSAHGVAQKVEDQAEQRGLPVIDATCPLVTKVHNEAIRREDSGDEVVLIGHYGHPEVEGTSGRVQGEVLLVESAEDVQNLKVKNPDKLSYVTQTTLSVNDTEQIIQALRQRFPNIKGPGLKDICYATQNRQNAVHDLAKLSDIVLVIGAQNSSNSNRLRDLAEEMGTKAYLINDERDIDTEWFAQFRGSKEELTIGVTAGASAPEVLTSNVVNYLKDKFPSLAVEEMQGQQENIKFKLPKQLT